MLLAGLSGVPVRAADPFSVREALESAARSLARSEPRAALDALAPVTRAEPDNPWMWFYTGSAHLALREPYPAMESFDRALDVLASLGDPDPALAETIRRHRRTARRQVFHVAARTGVAYDSNVTFLGGGVSGPGLIANQGDGLIASAFQLDFAPIADADQTLTVGARLGHSRQYSVESFNFQAYGGYVRYTRSLDSNVEAAIEYDYDASYLGNESFRGGREARGGLHPIAHPPFTASKLATFCSPRHRRSIVTVLPTRSASNRPFGFGRWPNRRGHGTCGWVINFSRWLRKAASSTGSRNDFMPNSTCRSSTRATRIDT